jgi:hypothetical protein
MPDCKDCQPDKMCNLHQFMWDTRIAAIRAMENPPPVPWQIRVRRWFDAGGGELDIWEVVAVVLLVRLIFG